MPVLLFESLRQGIDMETPGDTRAMTLSNKSSPHTGQASGNGSCHGVFW